METGQHIDSTSWKTLLTHSIRSARELSLPLNNISDRLKSVTDVYPMQINPYFLKLCNQKGAALKRQVIPDIRELDDTVGWTDPLAEDRDSPVQNLTRRYPDRVLFLVSNVCGVYCRFCTRKRKIGHWRPIKDKTIDCGVRYIREHPEIKDVLLSGGDPLLLDNDRLAWILDKIRNIPHVDIIRLGSRAPGVLPQRITPSLVRMLKKYTPLYLNLHFNHPDEITEEVKLACRRLANAGIPMGSQTVLLRGINDRVDILRRLFRELLKIRIRPYYLLQADLTRGTDHFRTRIETGLEIMKQLRGYISGMAVPHYVIDLPGGGGKVPLIPNHVVSLNPDSIVVKNFQGNFFRYPQTRFSSSGTEKRTVNQ
ncbi:KamA family radical SAM protein [bacterium]|nr:KamA family radical SAM protein [bacterium]